MEKRYSFIFSGDCLKNNKLTDVTNNLAKLFKITPNAWAPVFGKQAQFIRSGLDAYTAKKYYDAFTSAGALVKIVTYNAQSRTKSQPAAVAKKPPHKDDSREAK